MLYELLNFIGESGPITLFLLIIILLYKRKSYKLIFLFVIFQIVNNIINLSLKLLFKQPRPQPTNQYMFKANQYGMPSGHAQNIIAEALFIIYYFNNTYLTFFSLIQSFITLVQRYYGNFHTLMQILIGLLVGGLTSILFINYLNL